MGKSETFEPQVVGRLCPRNRDLALTFRQDPLSSVLFVASVTTSR